MLVSGRVRKVLKQGEGGWLVVGLLHLAYIHIPTSDDISIQNIFTRFYTSIYIRLYKYILITYIHIHFFAAYTPCSLAPHSSQTPKGNHPFVIRNM